MDYGVAFRIDEDSPALEMVAQHALSTRLVAVLSRLPVSSTIGLWAGGCARAARLVDRMRCRQGDLRDGLAEAGLSCVVGITLSGQRPHRGPARWDLEEVRVHR